MSNPYTIPTNLPQIGPATLAVLRASRIFSYIDVLRSDYLELIPGVGPGRAAVLRHWARAKDREEKARLAQQNAQRAENLRIQLQEQDREQESRVERERLEGEERARREEWRERHTEYMANLQTEQQARRQHAEEARSKQNIEYRAKLAAQTAALKARVIANSEVALRPSRSHSGDVQAQHGAGSVAPAPKEDAFLRIRAEQTRQQQAVHEKARDDFEERNRLYLAKLAVERAEREARIAARATPSPETDHGPNDSR